MNPSNPWKGKLEVASFLPSKSMYRQCVVLYILDMYKVLVNKKNSGCLTIFRKTQFVNRI
jgi:hypothetical protein